MATYKNRRQMNSETELSRYMSFVALENMRRKEELRLIRVDVFQADDQLPASSSWNAMLMGESMTAQYPGAALPPTSKRHQAAFRLL